MSLATLRELEASGLVSFRVAEDVNAADGLRGDGHLVVGLAIDEDAINFGA